MSLFQDECAGGCQCVGIKGDAVSMGEGERDGEGDLRIKVRTREFSGLDSK